jgi:hypothetical protein
MDNPLTSKDELIEDALHTYPLAPLPADLSSAVMSRIRSEPVVRFQLTWVDAALSLVLTLSLVAAWIGLQALPAPVLVQLRIQGILFWQSLLVNAGWLLPVASILAGSLVGFLALRSLGLSRRI